MKEQDYIKLMGSIRGEYLEEAVSWDGSERRRIRQIRRMTVSFGAVAAALAVVVGMIAYKANKDRIDIANSNTESSVTDDLESAQNLYGGHGELRQLIGTNGTICHDDDYVYEWDARWSVRSGGKVTYMNDDEKPQGLFMDGENLFRLHDGKVFETDSFGKETVLIDFTECKTDLEIDTNRITKIQKLSSRLVALFTDDPQDITAETVLIADLQKKRITLQPEVGGSRLFPDTESSYYVFGMQSQALLRYDMDTESGDAVWLVASEYDDPAYDLEFRNAVMQDGRLYLTGKYFKAGEEPDSVPDRYWIYDVNTKTLTEKTFDSNEGIYAGSAFLRALFEDGKYCVYRSTLDLEEEKLVFSVPVEQYFDTAAYGMPEMPDFLSVYESGDMLILHLPTSTDDAIPHPAKHGEVGVLVDLKSGKTLYYGENYDFSTPDDSSSAASAAAATDVSGGAAGTGTDTGAAGTTANGSGTQTTAKAVQTTAAAEQYKVADGFNAFGGKGSMTWLGGNFWQDDAYVYSIDGSRFTYHGGNSVMLNYAENICAKAGCKHDDESCPAYHFNTWQSGADTVDYVRNGKREKLLFCSGEHTMWMQRGNNCYRVNPDTGEETLMFKITQIDGMTLGEDELFVNTITAVSGAGGTATGRYLVSCGISLNVRGVNPDVIYVVLADTVNHTQKLVAKLNAEGCDDTLGALMNQGAASDGYFYSVRDGNVIVRSDGTFENRTEYQLPAGEQLNTRDMWCVYDNAVWFMNAKKQWCSFDLNTKAFRVVKEQVPVLEHETVSYCDGIFFAVRDEGDGEYSRTLLMFRYDFANSEEYHIQNITPLVGLGLEVNRFNDTFNVPFSAQDGFGIFVTNTPDWAPQR